MSSTAQIPNGMSLEEAAAYLTANEPVFAVKKAEIRGVDYQVFRNIPQHLRELLQNSSAFHGDGADEYLVYGEERWTYDAFCREVNCLANALRNQLNIMPGDRVAIAMRNYPEFLVLIMAISSIGAVVVFLNAWWTTKELDYALTDSSAGLVFADALRLQRLQPLMSKNGLRAIAVRDGEDFDITGYSQLRDGAMDDSWPEIPMQPDDDFAIMYSSGTTGHPKGVVLTHRGAISAVFSWLMAAAMAPLMALPGASLRPQVVLVVTPLFHVTATHPMFLLSLPAGAKLVILPKWDAQEAVQVIEKEHVTRFLGVPTQSAELMQAAERLGAALPSLEYIGAGGAKRPAAQVGQLAKAFPDSAIASGSGMTETNALGLMIAGPDYHTRPGSAGRLLPPLQEMRILDDAGNILPIGVVGELAVKSPANMRCYLNQPKATAEVLYDGWLRTGDLAVIDEEGYVTILDRKKHIIIRGGENIACLDVEGALHLHPVVLEACVFAVPDERLGEVVGAAIQTKPDMQLSPDEITAFLTPHIAGFKIPQHYWFFETPLLRGATDKIDRRGLRTRCLMQDKIPV